MYCSNCAKSIKKYAWSLNLRRRTHFTLPEGVRVFASLRPRYASDSTYAFRISVKSIMTAPRGV